jgi:hypothetical protein
VHKNKKHRKVVGSERLVYPWAYCNTGAA